MLVLTLFCLFVKPLREESNSEHGANVNYWNMESFMPFFGGDKVKELRGSIGNKAASKIQIWWRRMTKD